MSACLQMNDCRCCWRQPQVVHVDDIGAVDTEVMAPGHLLPNVEQQCIVAILLHVDGGLEDVALAHLFLSTFGCGDIDLLANAPIFLKGHGHAPATRVKLCHAVVVPKHTIALARQQHGQADLGVHLCEPPRQSAHVAEPVLELPQSEQALVLGRIKD